VVINATGNAAARGERPSRRTPRQRHQLAVLLGAPKAKDHGLSITGLECPLMLAELLSVLGSASAPQSHSPV